MATKIRSEEATTHTFDGSSFRASAFYMAVTLCAMAVGIWAAVAT